MRDLQGKVAVITGGASGIGRAMAEAFRDSGMTVVHAEELERLGIDEIVRMARAVVGEDEVGVPSDIVSVTYAG